MALFDVTINHGDVYTSSSDGWIWKVLPILTLILGILINRWLAFFDKKKRLKRAGKDLLTEIKLLKQPISSQIDSINALVNSLKEESFSPPVLMLKVQLKLGRIREINRTDIVDFFSVHSSSRELAYDKTNKIFNCLDIISANSERMLEYFQEYKVEGTLHFSNFKDNIDKCCRNWSEDFAIVERSGKTLDQDNFLKEIHDILLPALEGGEKELFGLQKSVVEPLALVIAKYRKDERASKFVEWIYQCNFSSNNIKRLRKSMVFRYEKIVESLNENFNILIKEIENIKTD